MVDGYTSVGQKTGYWANYFNRDIKQKGGLATAKAVLASAQSIKPGKGFQTLIDHGLVGVSVEATVLKPEFRSLFTPEELKEAQSRIDSVPAHGFRERVPVAEIHIEELDSTVTYREGASRQVVVNAYERDEKSRKACIAIHGYRCAVCTMQFDDVYGEIGKDFIHVHHRKPLASIREEYELNPEKDLVPVCPNCHAMLHTSIPPLSVSELQERYRKHNPA